MIKIGNRIRAVFFDLDETLLDDDSCMREAVTRTCLTLGERYPKKIQPEILENAYLHVSIKLWAAYGSVPHTSNTGSFRGRDLRIEVWGKALDLCGLPDQSLAIEVADLYSQERRTGYRLFPDVQSVLKTLQHRFILGLISNGPVDTQREKVYVTGLETYLPLLLISGELGVGKPDVGIFLKALESAQVMPSDSIHVGDSLDTDIAGAKNAGLYAVWINRKRFTKPRDMPNPDLEIFTLQELIPLLLE